MRTGAKDVQGAWCAADVRVRVRVRVRGRVRDRVRACTCSANLIPAAPSQVSSFK